jgi:hypothetical protein
MSFFINLGFSFSKEVGHICFLAVFQAWLLWFNFHSFVCASFCCTCRLVGFCCCYCCCCFGAGDQTQEVNFQLCKSNEHHTYEQYIHILNWLWSVFLSFLSTTNITIFIQQNCLQDSRVHVRLGRNREGWGEKSIPVELLILVDKQGLL